MACFLKDGRLAIYDVETGSLELSIKLSGYKLRCLQWSGWSTARGYYLVAGTSAKSCVVYSGTDLQVLQEFGAPHRDAVVSVAISSNLKFVATGTAESWWQKGPLCDWPDGAVCPRPLGALVDGRFSPHTAAVNPHRMQGQVAPGVSPWCTSCRGPTRAG